MTIMLVSDIFGVTLSLKELANILSTTGYEVVIVDPYDGIEHDFLDEEQAYTYFMKKVGLPLYAQHLEGAIAHCAKNMNVNRQGRKVKALIGFSIGASVIWQLSANKCMTDVEQAFYFYGSQIRHYIDIDPQVKSTVVFPARELHFSVDDLQKQIKMSSNVSTKRCKYLHGFMNFHSVNFNQNAYNHYTDWLCNKITVD